MSPAWILLPKGATRPVTHKVIPMSFSVARTGIPCVWSCSRLTGTMARWWRGTRLTLNCLLTLVLGRSALRISTNAGSNDKPHSTRFQPSPI